MAMHNEILNMFAQQGLVSLFGTAGVYAVPFWVFFRLNALEFGASVSTKLFGVAGMMPPAMLHLDLLRCFFS